MDRRHFYLIAGLLFSLPATAYDLLLNINGVIADNGCMVSADSQNLTVTFGNVATKQFYANGIAFGKRRFVIGLENCGAVATGVKVTFVGDADGDKPELLALTQESDVATGLAIEILDSAGVTVPIGVQTPSALLINPTASNALVFYAQYRSTGPVVSGSANAKATFVLEYQ